MLKKRSLRVMILCLGMWAICQAPEANAQYAVTDAGSYTYYAQQIKQLTQQLEAIKSQTLGQFERLEAIKSQVSGTYSGLTTVYQDLNGIKKTFESAPSTLQGEAQKWTKLKDLVTSYTGINDALGEVFKDPRSIDQNVNQIAYVNRQYNMRQLALKNSISHAENLLQSVQDRMATIDKLQAAAAKATSQSDKQDMTNAILIELLRTMTTYSSVLLEFHQAAALLNFKGADQEVMKKREASIWAVKKKTDSAANAATVSQSFKNLGVDAGMSSNYKF